MDYCSTKDMLADFFTKPLQGSLFLKFRDMIMNVDPSGQNHPDHRSVLEINPVGEYRSGADDETSATHKSVAHAEDSYARKDG